MVFFGFEVGMWLVSFEVVMGFVGFEVVMRSEEHPSELRSPLIM